MPKRDETPRWKFAILVWIAIFPAITGLNYLMEPVWKDWEIWQKLLFSVSVEVPYAVFLAIPFLQWLFKGWLKEGEWGR